MASSLCTTLLSHVLHWQVIDHQDQKQQERRHDHHLVVAELLQDKEDMANCEQYLLLPDQRYLFGMQGVVVYASSHPSSSHHACLFNIDSPRNNTTFNTVPKKSIFALDNSEDEDREFVHVFETLHPQIVTAIRTTYCTTTVDLNLLRLGFDRTNRSANPITIYVVVGSSTTFLEYTACKMVSAIRTVVMQASVMTSIHIDVCHACAPFSLPSSPSSFSLLDRNPEVYNSSVRLPYASIGPAEHNSSGTVTSYIKHREEDGRSTVYGVTCAHVADPEGTLGRDPFVVEDNNGTSGDRQVQPVQCPARSDHNFTLQTITTQLKGVRHWASQSHIATLQKTLARAQQYNIDFGHVYATSGIGRVLPQHTGRSDWALISLNPDVVPQNKHVRTTDSFLSFEHPEFPPHIDAAFVDNAMEYFGPGPHLKAVRESDLQYPELVFKPRSRTTSKWVAGTFNGVQATQIISEGVTREWCLVALDPQGTMGRPGDSGSVILDRDFRPVAMLWGGRTGLYGSTRICYASPLSKVAMDIENCMQWTRGSVSML